jgi:hypothetical protein
MRGRRRHSFQFQRRESFSTVHYECCKRNYNASAFIYANQSVGKLVLCQSEWFIWQSNFPCYRFWRHPYGCNPSEQRFVRCKAIYDRMDERRYADLCRST